jgi:hypothetical protein
MKPDLLSVILGSVLLVSGVFLLANVLPELIRIAKRKKQPITYRANCYTCGFAGLVTASKNSLQVTPCACVNQA